MNARVKKDMKNRALFVLLPFAAVAILAFAFISCDSGRAPESATGPDATYDPLFDEPRPGVTARVSPNTVTTPDPVTDRDAETTLIGRYRDPGGNPVSGLQMNFTADPVNPNITFNPPAGFTDSNGDASTRVIVGRDTISGSVILVAYTSPASSGPNARGQTTLWVNQGETVDAPGVPVGSANPIDQCTLLSCPAPLVPPLDTGSVAYVSTGPTRSSLGNPVTYRYDCGNGVFSVVPAQTAGTCNYTAAGTYQVRAQAISTTGVASSWSGSLTVAVSDNP